MIIEGSHKVPIPTAELLALAEGGLAGAEGSELVKHVPMDVGDTMFFMVGQRILVLAERKCLVVVKRIRVLGPQETLIHAAPEVCCNDCYLRPCMSKVFAQLLWLCCAHRSVL